MTTIPKAPEYDFDSWSDADEEKAIAALVPDVRHIIVEKRFIGRFTDMTTFELPLTLTLEDVDSLESEAGSPIDQVTDLLTKLGGEKVAKEFVSHDFNEATILAERYFGIFQKVQQAARPE